MSFGNDGQGQHGSWSPIQSKQRDNRIGFTNLNRVILGDFDGDGTTDVHYWAKYHDQTDDSWLISYGQKGLQRWSHLPFKKVGSSVLNASNFKVGDFNNDNRDDIISPTVYQGGSWYVSHGLADKTLNGWEVLNHLGSIFYHVPVRVGDLDGNGKADLIFVNNNGNSIEAKLIIPKTE